MEDLYHIAVPSVEKPTYTKASACDGDSSNKLREDEQYAGEVGQENDRRHSKRTPKPNFAYLDSSPSSSSLHKKTSDGEQLMDVEGNDDAAVDDPELADSQSGLGNALPAVKNYFFNRLAEVLKELGAQPDTLDTWGTQCIKRPGGLVQGIIDVYYYNGKGRKFRTRVEAAVSLGLMPYARQLRQMSKEQLFITAMEIRERYLVGQKLFMNGMRCESIDYDNDDIIINLSEEDLAVAAAAADSAPTTILDPLRAPSPAPKTEPDSTTADSPAAADAAALVEAVSGPQEVVVKPPPPLVIHKEGCFSWGNITVLDWGNIITNPHFHTVTQLYPIGFRCIRQEHDIVLDRVVDCLCEISRTYGPGEGDDEYDFVPIFRISVAWDLGLGPGKQVVRTYEARSPQQAWQAVMLETIGTETMADAADINAASATTTAGATDTAESKTAEVSSTSVPEGRESSSADDAVKIVDAVESEPTEFEQFDKEEIKLRSAVRERRRAYFRALREEQKQGIQAPFKPRLMVDTLDSFVDTALLRMIEGMQRAVDCKAYQFVDYRDRDAGKKSFLRSLAQVHYKGKLLDKVLRRQYSTAAPGGAGSKGADKKRPRIDEDERKRRQEEQEARKKARVEDKEARIRNMMMEANRKNEVKTKIRDMEKTVRGIKEVLIKTIRKRRDEARLRVEIVNEREEAIRTSKLAASAAAVGGDDANASQPPSLAQTTQVCTSTQLKDREPMPEPSTGTIRIDGDVYGQTLELWGFLATFAVPLRLNTIPSIQRLANAFKACDAAYKRLRSRTRGAERCFDVVSGSFGGLGLDFNVPEPIDAAALLDSVGLAMCETLMVDFNRLMGLEAAEASLGNCYVPLNELTWREIFRMVQIGMSCREIGMNEVDIVSTLKGKGYHTTPETADRKALKIARRRIIFNYTIREENQEALTGFTGGLILRIPTPTTCAAADADWDDIISALVNVPDSSVWLVNDMIELAMVLCDRSANPAIVPRLKKSLRMCTKPPIFNVESAAEAKRLALSLLRFAHTDEAASAAGSSGGSSTVVVKHSPIVSSSGASSAAAVAGVQAANAIAEIAAAAAVDDIDNEFCLDCSSSRTIQRPHELPASTFAVWARQSRWLTRTARSAFSVADGLALSLDKAAGDFNEEDVDVTAAAAATEPDNMAVDDDNNNKEKDKEKSSAEDDLVKEAVAAENLSVAMQRCYLVIRDLMSHPLASPFCNAVDPRTVPLYYRLMAQPICFADIKKTLLEGGYGDSITKFYCDVNLVLENALAYNPENSNFNSSAQKLTLVFDRMFLETVLSWDNPVPFSDSCLGCRSMESVASSKFVQCERCDACYHLGCLDPPMTIHPRSEWYCPSCIEQKGISSVHPNRSAEVAHPEDSELRGIVVGIDQIKQTLRFVVDFGSRRELWSGEKVRKYSVPPHRKFDFSEPHHHAHLTFDDDATSASPRDGDEDGASSPRSSRLDAAASTSADDVRAQPRGGSSGDAALGMSTQSTAAARASSALATIQSPSRSAPLSAFAKAFPGFNVSLPPVETVPPTLPSGYTYEDYDTVCGLARGHIGWGAPLNMLPPALSDSHSMPSRNRGRSDPFFNLHRAALVALGPQSDASDLGAKEWLAILRSLAQRVIATPQLSTSVAGMDDEGDATQEASMEHIIGGTSSYDNLIRKARCIIADEIVIGDPPLISAEEKLLQVPAELTMALTQKSTADDSTVQSSEASPGKTDSIAPSSARLTPKDDDKRQEQLQQQQQERGRKSSLSGQKGGRKSAGGRPSAGGSSSGDNLSSRFDEDRNNDSSRGGDDSMVVDTDGDNAVRLVRGDGDDDSDADILDEMDFGDSSDEADGDGDGDSKSRSESPAGRGRTTPTSMMEADDAAAEGDDDDTKSRASFGDFEQGDRERRASTSAAESDVTADWELRRQSRKKGREDALLTQNLVWEVLKDVDLDGEKDADGKPVDPEFYGAVFTSVVKACLSRASEYLDVSEWSKGWGLQMESFVDQNASIINKLIETGTSRVERKTLIDITPEINEMETNGMYCQLCGFDEEYLASQMIMGQTFQEWEEMQDLTLSSAVIATDKRRRVMNDPNDNKVWIPCCKRASEIELRECTLADKEPRNGSVVAHECCAEFLAVFRSVTMTRARRAEEQKIVNTLSFIGSAKNAPIGTDREGSNYWVFAGSPALYVCTEVKPYFPQEAPEGISANFFTKGKKYLTGCYSSAVPGNVFSFSDGSNCGFAPKDMFCDSGDGSSKTYVWRVYESMVDIGRLVRWLDVRDPDERLLKRILMLLYPHALVAVSAAAPAASNTEALDDSVKDLFSEEQDATGKIVSVALKDENNTTQAVTVVETNKKAEKSKKSEEVDQASESEVDEDVGDDGEEEEEEEDDGEEAEMEFEPRVSKRVRVSAFPKGVDDGVASAVPDTPGSLRVGQKVIVPAGGFSGIPWDGRITEVRTVEKKSATTSTAAATSADASAVSDGSAAVTTEKETIYCVRFERWGATHDGWYKRDELRLPANNTFVDRTMRMRARDAFANDHVYAVPDVLQTLYAYQYLYQPDRACAVEDRPPLTFSDTVTPLGTVKAAMLMLEACLPQGCIDDADDRWGNNFVVAWREAVVSASDATALMQCQVMLEYGIRTAWYTAPGLKLLSCMPSRLQSMRTATVSLVALRLWCLDQALRYDKVGNHEKSAAGGSQKSGKGQKGRKK